MLCSYVTKKKQSHHHNMRVRTMPRRILNQLSRRGTGSIDDNSYSADDMCDFVIQTIIYEKNTIDLDNVDEWKGFRFYLAMHNSPKVLRIRTC